ncbi:hypothetical protein AN958_11069 [Leucoagaricus sp. SymC.cos]|nr:hypothetical protein AN958_11069 [Leucoagaricus sp. SymC.cos]
MQSSEERKQYDALIQSLKVVGLEPREPEQVSQDEREDEIKDILQRVQRVDIPPELSEDEARAFMEKVTEESMSGSRPPVAFNVPVDLYQKLFSAYQGDPQESARLFNDVLEVNRLVRVVEEAKRREDTLQAIASLFPRGHRIYREQMPERKSRKIDVPLQTLDKCHVCGGTEQLRLCNSCASAIYCSKQCQTQAWKFHKTSCAKSHQINLKYFYPLIAYLFESLRKHRDPVVPLHPILDRNIIKAEIPGPRASARPNEVIWFTVILDGEHDLGPGGGINKFQTWWKGHPTIEAGQKMYHQAVREVHIPELTVSICMTLLAEIYSSEFADMPGVNTSGTQHVKPCFRLEYGRSPIRDFGICKGKIRGNTNAVQVWTYKDEKTQTSTTLTDPDKYYWIYFTTIRGEEIVPDCCSQSFGMLSLVNASHCVEKLPEQRRIALSARVPAFLWAPGDEERRPYALIPDKRFSVMQKPQLCEALSMRNPHQETSKQRLVILDFFEEMLGRKATEHEVNQIKRYRLEATMVLNEVLSNGYWREWGIPEVYNRDCLDEEFGYMKNYQTLVRGAPAKPVFGMVV